MFCFSHSFSPKRLKKEEQSRVRVLGEANDSRLLLSINTPTFTNIEVVSSDGESMTAISFPHYIDFVNASLSPDNELLHVVQRIPSPKGFSFSSKIINIFGKQVSKEVLSDDPIWGIFLPMKKEIILHTNSHPQIDKSEIHSNNIIKPPPNNYKVIKTYQLLHFIGPKLHHLSVTLTDKSLDIQIIRGGVNLPYVIAYHYFRESSSLAVIYQDEKLAKLAYFQFTEDSIRSKNPQSIEVLHKSQLPIELALSPSSQRHFPVFRNQTRRFFFAKAQGQDYVIQQLYSENDSSLSFNISSYPRPFSQNISIPGVAPDHPICCFRLPSLLILFIPNLFSVVIDINRPTPVITTMPVSFSLGCTGPLASNLMLDNTIIDIDTGDIYKLSVQLSNLHLYSKTFTETTIPTIATICARLCQPQAIADFLICLQKLNDPYALFDFISCLISEFNSTANPSFARSKSVMGLPPSPNSFSNLRKVNSLAHMTIGSLKGPTSEGNRLYHHLPSQKNKFTSQTHLSKKMKPSHALQDIIQAIENEFPSAGKVQRYTTFKKIYLDFTKDKDVTEDEAAEKALKVLKSQNDYSLVLRQALDSYIKESSPLYSFLAELLVETETEFESLPSVKCLKSELTKESSEVCPKQIVSKLSSNGVIHSVFSEKEAKHWQARIPSYLFDKPKSNTSSSSDTTSSSFSSAISPSHSQLIVHRLSKDRTSLSIPKPMISQSLHVHTLLQ